MELISHFNKFLSNIEPAPTYVAEASVGHITLRRRLESDDKIKDEILDTFLSGSYARKTAVTPIKDVDVIVLLNLNRYANKPKDVFGLLRRVLRRYYPNKTILQRRSIRIALRYIQMDVVPGVPSNGTNSPIYIPDRSLQRWILTHPKGHIQLTRRLNKENSELFIPLVKAIKWWRNYKIPDAIRPKSIIMETILSKVVNQYKIDSLPMGLLSFFKYVINNYAIYALLDIVPKIDDPILPRNNVAQGWTTTNFKNFIAKVKWSYRTTLKALDSPHKNETIRLWKLLLGPKFPSDV